jgi:hypothetical protein
MIHLQHTASSLIIVLNSQVLWREYVPVAWQVDRCLVLSLLDCFSASLHCNY